MYEGIAYLLGASTSSFDTYGNESITYERRKVYVMSRGVYSSEYYTAAQAGLHPSKAFELTNRADYNGELLIEYENETYNIIRTDWNAQKDKIALVCEKRIANGPA